MSDKQAKKSRKQIEALIQRAGMSEDEVLIAIERYQQAEQDRAHMQPNALAVAVLPGTALEIPDAERLRLVKGARQRGIHSGYYEDWELMQFGDAIVDSRDAQWLDRLEDLVPLMALYERIQLRLSDMSVTIQVHVQAEGSRLWKKGENDKVIYPFSEEDAGQLVDWYTQMRIFAQRLGAHENDLPNPLPFAEGIRALLNEQDSTPLIKAALEHRAPITPLIELIANMKGKFGGKPRDNVIDRLCERGLHYRLDGCTYDTALTKITEDVATELEHAQAQGEPTTLLEEENEKLATWDVDAFRNALKARYPTLSEQRGKGRKG